MKMMQKAALRLLLQLAKGLMWVVDRLEKPEPETDDEPDAGPVHSCPCGWELPQFMMLVEATSVPHFHALVVCPKCGARYDKCSHDLVESGAVSLMARMPEPSNSSLN